MYGEGPEVEEEDRVRGRDLADEGGGCGRRVERLIECDRLVGAVVNRLDELDGCCGAKGVAGETDGAGLVDVEKVGEYTEHVFGELLRLIWRDVL